MKRNGWKLSGNLVLIIVLAVSLLGAGEDRGFTVIYEGPVQPEGPPQPVPATSLELSLYGNAGFSAFGTFWATAGGTARLDLGGFAVYVDASGGTDGLRALVGAETKLSGFKLAGDVTLSPGRTPVVDLRGWGAFDTIRLTANARLAGPATSMALGVSTDFGGYGVSGNLGFSSGALSTASVGANTELGALSLSASGGWAGGRFNAGGGLALRMGAVNVAAQAGYDTGLGINATGSAGMTLDGFQLTAIGLYDNTGIGLETSGELQLGAMLITFMGRFSLGNMSFEVGGQLPLGPLLTTFSVALDNQNGFSWAEAGFELPL